MVKSKTITVQGIDISLYKHNDEDYICITDMIKAKDGDFFITDWLRNRNTLEFLGVWERMYNPNFNYGEFAIIKNKSGLNNFKISVKEWTERTNAIGLIAKTGVACCLMHNRENTDYQNFLADFMDDMKECVKIAKDAGIADDRIILDPGVGFGKTYEMNLEIIDKLEIMKELGYPVLLGTSRKSVIGLTLDLPVEEREEGTMVTTVYGVQKGCAFVRVHDVEKNKRAIRMTRALMREHEV